MRRTGGSAAIGLALLLAVLGAGRARAADAEPWTPLGRGVEHRLLEGAIAGHAFRFRPADVELHVVPASGGHARVADLAPAGEAIATNASFFDETGRAMGLAVDRGRSLGGRRLSRWAGFVVERERPPRIVAGTALGDGAGAELVVQGLPRLVVAGAVPRLKPQRAQRTVVCVGEGRVVLLVTTTRVEAGELAQLLAAAPAAGGLGCRDALNLDGGGSTQLHARWGDFGARIEGAWGVPNALVVVPKPGSSAR